MARAKRSIAGGLNCNLAEAWHYGGWVKNFLGERRSGIMGGHGIAGQSGLGLWLSLKDQDQSVPVISV
jgi:hypothetical protein